MRSDADRPESRLDLRALERLSPDAPLPRPPRGPILAKIVAIVLPLAVLGLVPWLLITQVFGGPDAQPSPSPSSSVSPSPAASATPGQAVYEVDVAEDCLNVRAAPGVQSTLVDCLTPGFRVTGTGALRDVAGQGWVHIRYGTRSGWVAERYLRRVN